MRRFILNTFVITFTTLGLTTFSSEAAVRRFEKRTPTPTARLKADQVLKNIRLIKAKNDALLLESVETAKAGRRTSAPVQANLVQVQSTSPSTDAGAFLAALQAQPTILEGYNNLFGTQLKATAAPSSEDAKVLSETVAVAGFNADQYFKVFSTAGSLLSAIRPTDSLLASFNRVYGTSIPKEGALKPADFGVMVRVISEPSFEYHSFLWSLPAATPPVATTPISEPPVVEPPAPVDSPAPVEPPVETPAPVTSGQIFGPESIWNKPLEASAAADANSSGLVNELVANTKLAQTWINTDHYSTPLYKVNASTPRESVKIVQNGQELVWTELNKETKKGVPIPQDAAAAAGTDGHITILDTDSGKLYEFWQFKKVNGQWQASWGGIIENVKTSNGVMPPITNSAGGTEYWGATATGLPAIGGAILIEELKAGKIPHALAVAVVRAKRNSFVAPAQRTDGWWDGPNAIPEGTRFRFPSDMKIDPSWSPLIKMMVEAVRDYGMIVRDQAGCVTFYGEDPTPYGAGDPYRESYGGLELWDVMKQFPWEKLEALAP